jgi:hypothetical protein
MIKTKQSLTGQPVPTGITLHNSPVVRKKREREREREFFWTCKHRELANEQE